MIKLNRFVLAIAAASIGGTVLAARSPDPHSLLGAMDGLALNCERIANVRIDVDSVMLQGADKKSPELREQLKALRDELRSNPAAREKYEAAFKASVAGDGRLSDREVLQLKETCRDLQR
jgi:hypothetical protein